MSSKNRTFIVGHTSSPQRVLVPTGEDVCTLQVRRTSKGTNPDVAAVRVRGSQALLCLRMLTEGDLVAVEGDLVEGQIHADRITFLTTATAQRRREQE